MRDLSLTCSLRTCSLRLLLVVLAVLSVLACGSVSAVWAQSAALSAQVQQSQAQVQQLQQRQQTEEQRRTRLLDEQRKLLSLQAQIQTQIDQIRKELQKPLAPDQVEKQRCALREQRVKQQQAQQRQEQVRREIVQNQQQLSQTGRQLSQAQQQLSQAQQQLEQANQQEQAAQQAAGRQDKLSKIMQAPADPLNGLPLTAVPGGGTRRVIVLGIEVLFKSPTVTSITFDPGRQFLEIVHGPAGGSWRLNTFFMVSDESIQTVRVRLYRDSATPPVGFFGLVVTARPARMNAKIASFLETFGSVGTYTDPPGVSSSGHYVVDVPDDPSIEPAIVRYITH